MTSINRKQTFKSDDNKEIVIQLNPLPAADPIRMRLLECLEAYVEGKSLMSDAHKREIIAAYLSGMNNALDMVEIKPKRGYLVLPAVLQRKVIDFARGLGMEFHADGKDV